MKNKFPKHFSIRNEAASFIVFCATLVFSSVPVLSTNCFKEYFNETRYSQ